MADRRDFLNTCALGLVSALALSANSASAQDQKMVLQLAWLPNAAAAGEIVALKKGYFKDLGLDVEILSGGPSSNPVQETLAGVATIAHAYAPQIMYAGNQGLPIKSFGASFQKAPLTFFSLGESNIKTVKDWKGKNVGAAQSAEAQLKAILDYNGMSMSDITFVQAQPPALMQGQVDVVASWPTNVAQIAPITTHPGGYNTQTIWDNGLQFQSNYYVATTATIENDTAALVKFMEAVDKGWSYAADNPKDAIEMVASMSEGLDRDKELDALTVMFDVGYIYNEDTREFGFANVDAGRWQRTLDTYAKIGEVKETLKAADVFDDRVLKAAKRTKR